VNREQFLHFVFEYVKTDPEVTAYLNSIVESGLRSAFEEANKIALDMETIALAFMDKKIRGKQLRSMVVPRLKSHANNMHFNWQPLIDEMEKEQPK